MRLTSSAFDQGAAIPRLLTCDGQDVSPPLTWSELPAATVSLALICDDPDAPAGTWVHWVIFNIDPALPGLPQGVAREPGPKQVPGAVQGVNTFPWVGYGGPCPPPRHGPHRYFFKLYALDAKLSLTARATKADLEKAMAGHVLDHAQLMGTYERR